MMAKRRIPLWFMQVGDRHVVQYYTARNIQCRYPMRYIKETTGFKFRTKTFMQHGIVCCEIVRIS